MILNQNNTFTEQICNILSKNVEKVKSIKFQQKNRE